MERFVTTDWAAHPAWSAIISIVLVSMIVVGHTVNRLAASRTYSALAEFRGGKKAAIFSIIKYYWIGFSGSSVMVFCAAAIGGFAIHIIEYVIVIIIFWTYYLAIDHTLKERAI